MSVPNPIALSVYKHMTPTIFHFCICDDTTVAQFSRGTVFLAGSIIQIDITSFDLSHTVCRLDVFLSYPCFLTIYVNMTPEPFFSNKRAVAPAFEDPFFPKDVPGPEYS